MNPLYIILIIIIAVLFLIGVWALIEPHILDMTKISLPAGGGAEQPSLRVFFFSDVHGEFCFISPSRVCSEIDKAKAEGGLDAVVFGGDISTRKMFGGAGAKYLAKIAAHCKETGIPFYGVLGNHDAGMSRDIIDSCGFTDIGGKCVVIESISGKKVALAGVTDSGRKHRQWYQLPETPEGLPVVCVVHDPDALIHFENKPACAVCGHFHGGQVKMPFHLEFVLLRHDTLPRQGIIEGVHEVNGIPVFISRGIGCGALPVRLMSKPEASVVEIK